MIVSYEWLEENGDAPAKGTFVEVSGDPDRAVLRGIVAEVLEEGSTLHILLGDGQEGSDEFQLWLLGYGEMGVKVAEQQTWTPV